MKEERENMKERTTSRWRAQCLYCSGTHANAHTQGLSRRSAKRVHRYFYHENSASELLILADIARARESESVRQPNQAGRKAAEAAVQECEEALVRRPGGNDVAQFSSTVTPQLALHHIHELLPVA